MQILGMLEALENFIAESSHIPFTKKVIVDGEKLLALLRKMRAVVQTQGQVINKRYGRHMDMDVAPRAVPPPNSAVLREAEDYAQDVLEHLETVIVRIQRQIESGKEKLSAFKQR